MIYSCYHREALRNSPYVALQAHFGGHTLSPFSPLSRAPAPELKRLLMGIPENKRLHAHCLFGRGYPGVQDFLDRNSGQSFEAAMQSFEERISAFPRIKDWTLCNELLLAGGAQFSRNWPHFVQRTYRHFADRFPDTRFWLGEYGVRERRNVDRVLAGVEQIRKLGGRVDGIVWICYIDLADWGYARSHLAWLDAWPGPLANLRYAIEAAQREGLSTALETGVFVGRSTSMQMQAQDRVYRALIELCKDTNTDYWQWWPFDSPAKINWLSEDRNAIESVGWWDRDWQPKWDWVEDLGGNAVG